MKKVFTVFAQDPGMVNFGYAVLRVDASTPKLKVSILQYGRLLTTVHSLKLDLRSQVNKFSAELEGLHSQFGFDALIAERYQSRRMGGTTIECVNLMLGISANQFKHLPFKFIPASQWKNAAARQAFWFDELYTSLKPLKVTPHAVDAVCIGIFGICRLLKIPAYQIGKLSALERLLRKSKHEDIGTGRIKPPKKKTRRRAPPIASG